ncbi:MAG: gamma-glutamyltransferase [Firmicutes bacterium]|nr:gamma-glutamyltransferase [Bacillota bacterium]
MDFHFDPLSYPHASRRSVVYGRKGMVATGNPLAAQAGLEILKKGGNAIDAMIATAAALTVVEPTANGIGGDAFALVWVKDKLYGLNASGPAPQAMTLEALQERGYKEMPTFGMLPVTVPGAPAGWAELSERFGKLPFEELMEPAARYAEEGYVLQPGVGSGWPRNIKRFENQIKNDPSVQGWFDTFLPGGKVMKTGDVLVLKDHANTLREIGRTKAESFYRGELADKIDAYFRQFDSFLRKEDLAAYKPEWVDPITVNYKGYDVYEIPPNGHGISTLMALNILKDMDLGPLDSFQSTHLQLEAMKLAFADAQKYVADPKWMKTPVERLLSDDYAAERRALIGDTARLPEPGEPIRGGTVYMCAADGEGNMISYIQSNYMGFGSGVVVPGTGIAMHNRGNNFSMDPNSDNCVAPGKRPYHTIIPGFLAKDGKAIGPFGVMGGFMQPQGHLQVVLNTVEYGMNPQAALDHPRWQWVGKNTIEVESTFPNDLAQMLQRAGHDIVVKADPLGFGRGEIIWRNEEGVLCGACEPRTDGHVAVW